MNMKIAMASLALTGAIALAGSTLSQADAPPTSMDQCKALQKEFDAANKSKASATKFREARKQRMHGADLCSEGDTAGGVKALELALHDIGKR